MKILQYLIFEIKFNTLLITIFSDSSKIFDNLIY